MVEAVIVWKEGFDINKAKVRYVKNKNEEKRIREEGFARHVPVLSTILPYPVSPKTSGTTEPPPPGSVTLIYCIHIFQRSEYKRVSTHPNQGAVLHNGPKVQRGMGYVFILCTIYTCTTRRLSNIYNTAREYRLYIFSPFFIL